MKEKQQNEGETTEWRNNRMKEKQLNEGETTE